MDLEKIRELKDRVGLSKMSTPALVGIVAVILVVAVVAAGRLIGTATATEFEVSKSEATAQSEQEPEGGSDGVSPSFVHVSGAVEKPGLYEVAAGGRVADAVNAAGGFTEDASIESVNLARVVSDGEQIVVARQSSDPAPGQQAASSDSAVTAQPAVPAASGGLVNINTASAAELQSLPGIGVATAEKIVSDRQANGAYKTVEDLKRVSGIGDKKFEALSGLICV